ncbi:hypothetical protein [Paenibacillus sp. NPDC055715]
MECSSLSLTFAVMERDELDKFVPEAPYLRDLGRWLEQTLSAV